MGGIHTFSAQIFYNLENKMNTSLTIQKHVKQLDIALLVAEAAAVRGWRLEKICTSMDRQAALIFFERLGQYCCAEFHVDCSHFQCIQTLSRSVDDYIILMEKKALEFRLRNNTP